MPEARTKIIAVMPHGPAYHFAPGEPPEIAWKRSDGGVVGFWPREWLDVLGEAVLKETDAYDWEVWQPDYRADKIYSRTLPTGVIHSLFPAAERLYRVGMRRQNGIYSEALIKRLKELRAEPLVLMCYSVCGFHQPFYRELLRTFGPGRKFPIFLRSGGMFNTPAGEFWAPHRPLTYLSLVLEQFEVKNLYRHVDAISEQSAAALAKVRGIYAGRVERLTMGCDFAFWTPAPSPGAKKAARKNLGIPQDRTVFFASGNFMPRKQLDRLIKAFYPLNGRGDFFLIVAGQGEEKAAAELKLLAGPLTGRGNALLHPYAVGERLRDIYRASDVYVSVATDEGGPASVMKAMACGLPVISTPVGETADRMREHGAGRLVPVKNHEEWTEAFRSALDGEMPRALDRGIAKEAYDWPNVARRFIRVYDELSEKYFGR